MKSALLFLALCFIALNADIEKNIVVVIPSYNNALYYQKNLDSVVQQNYTQYRIIYIDDCSTDGTADLVEVYLNEHGIKNSTFIRNTQNVKGLANMYRAVHSCADTDIIVELDGDDAFVHNNVLSRINKVFSRQDVWVAYSQFINVLPDGKKYKGLARATPQEWIDARDYRSKWIWSGTRAFYAWLYKQIKLEDLIMPTGPYAGKFLPVAKDGAAMYPMLEMAGSRFTFINEALLYRHFTPINDFKINQKLQVTVGDFLRSRPKYPVLDAPVVTNAHS